MKRISRLSAAVFVLTLTAAFVFPSEPGVGAESPLISGFEIEGLKRTKPSVIEPYYRNYIGSPYTEAVRKRIIQDLRRLGIFYSVDVVPLPRENGEVVVKIYAEEKWTLVPIPLAGASGDSYYGGLLLFESNLFGLNKKFYGGGILASTGWKAMAGYIDPRLAGSSNSLHLGFSGGYDTVENAESDGTVYQKYRSTRINLMTEYGYRFTDYFSTGFGFQYTEIGIDEDYSAALMPVSGGKYFGPTVSFRYQNFYYDKILVHGVSALGRYERKFGSSDYDKTSLLAQWYLPVASGRAGLLLNGVFAPESPREMETEVSGKFFKTLPDGVSADSSIAAQALLEVVPFNFGWGALSFVLFYEGGLFVQDKSKAEYTNGPGAGIRVYLAKVAAPAFGFDAAYNADDGGVHIFVNVGMQM